MNSPTFFRVFGNKREKLRQLAGVPLMVSITRAELAARQRQAGSNDPSFTTSPKMPLSH